MIVKTFIHTPLHSVVLCSLSLSLSLCLSHSPSLPLSSLCGSLLEVVMNLTCLNKLTPMPQQKRPRLPHKTTPTIPALVWAEEKRWRLTSDLRRVTVSVNLTLHFPIDVTLQNISSHSKRTVKRIQGIACALYSE